MPAVDELAEIFAVEPDPAKAKSWVLRRDSPHVPVRTREDDVEDSLLSWRVERLAQKASSPLSLTS